MNIYFETRWLRAMPIGAAMLFLIPYAAVAASPPDQDRDRPDDASNRWAAIATQATQSPVQAAPTDIAKEWTAPDGRLIRVVVKQPPLTKDGPNVTMRSVPDGEDARPAFEAAVSEAIAKHASLLLIPSGNYVFKTTVPGVAHAVIKNASDLTVDGQGSSFIFATPAPGILIGQSRRIKIQRLNFSYAIRLASLGTIVVRDNENMFVVDPDFPITNKEAAYFFSEVDPVTHRWIAGAPRVILAPGDANAAVFTGNQTYRSPRLRLLKPGAKYVVFHYWYGSPVVSIYDSPGASQDEDITLDRIEIDSGPGLGIQVYGLKRGLAITNSRIMAKPDNPTHVSTLYDAIHVISGGGDLYLTGNHIANQGDDGINLNNPQQMITDADAQGRTLKMSKFSRFISNGDNLAFFDNEAGYLGNATVSQPRRPLGGLDNEITIDRAMPEGRTSVFVRDIALIASRYYIANNLIEDCKCHGMLLQLPNGLVENNIIRNSVSGAIRMLTDVGSWHEGVGAYNIILRHNTITNSGVDEAKMVPWAAITVYGGGHAGPTKNLTNGFLDISNNEINNPSLGCITVSNSFQVKLTDNRCTKSVPTEMGESGYTILHSATVTINGKPLL